MQPSAYMSVAPSVSRPSACSGDQYSGVPSSTPIVVARAAGARDAGEAEVGRDDAAAVALDEDVRRRQVAVDDALRVRVVERLADGRRVRGGLAPRQRQPMEGRAGEAPPVDELHDEKRLRVRLDVVVDADDVVARERRKRPRLPREPAAPILLRRDERPQELDGDVALEPRVARAPDDAHPAFSDLLDQLVAASQDPHPPSFLHPVCVPTLDATAVKPRRRVALVSWVRRPPRRNHVRVPKRPPHRFRRRTRHSARRDPRDRLRSDGYVDPREPRRGLRLLPALRSHTRSFAREGADRNDLGHRSRIPCGEAGRQGRRGQARGRLVSTSGS